MKKTIVATVLVLVLGLGGSASAALVAHYKLDEGGGTIAADASGNGHHGTAQNGVPTWVEGQPDYGKAMHFDGTEASAWVDCGTFNPSEGTGQLTVAVWVKWDGPNGSYQGLIAKSDEYDDQGTEMMWMLEISKDNHDVFFQRAGSWVWCGGIVLPEGQWSHVAATFDGSTLIFYVDGAETGRGDWSFGAKTEATIVFGAAYQAGWNRFNGALDDVRLYDHALSENEIAALAGSVSADLVAHYEFENNVLDSAGSNHGTAHGGPGYVSGVFGQAINLDGDDDYIDCGNDPAFDITERITVAAWVKTNNDPLKG